MRYLAVSRRAPARFGAAPVMGEISDGCKVCGVAAASIHDAGTVLYHALLDIDLKWGLEDWAFDPRIENFAYYVVKDGRKAPPSVPSWGAVISPTLLNTIKASRTLGLSGPKPRRPHE